MGNGVFLTPKPSFPNFGDLTPVQGQGFRKPCCLAEHVRDGKVHDESEHSHETFIWERGLSGLVAGDSAICGRLAALILRLRPAGLRFEEFRSPVKRGGLGLRFSNRSGLRPAAI